MCFADCKILMRIRQIPNTHIIDPIDWHTCISLIVFALNYNTYNTRKFLVNKGKDLRTNVSISLFIPINLQMHIFSYVTVATLYIASSKQTSPRPLSTVG